MPLDVITSLNQTQRIPELIINERTVLQPNTYYTVPAGKKARVKYRIQGGGLGAAATIFSTISGVRIGTWSTANAQLSYGENAVFGNNVTYAIGVWATGTVLMDSGDTIVTDQSSGTNAEFNVFLSILELPA